MIDHFEIKVLNFKKCVRFYQEVLPSLDMEMKWSDQSAAGFGKATEPNVRFLIERVTDQPQNCHIAFAAPDQSSVENFHATGLKAGYQSNGAPGLREHYNPNYYAAFLIDPDGNNIEAVVYL